MSANIRIGYASTVLLASAALLLPNMVQAMEIRKYDKMADQDQAEYVGLLVQGAEKVLTDEGKADLAAQVDKLFLTIPAGDKMSLGMTEFERNLAIARADDAKNAVEHPNDPRSHVEDAMAITLENNGIKLPDSFYTVAKSFKPKHPFQVMEIRAFDKMTDEDQTGYVLQMLLVVAKQMTIQGEKPLAARMARLFSETPAGEKQPVGMSEFRKNLAVERQADARGAAKTPPGPRVWVEDAMADTLRQNGFDVPNSLYTGVKDFKPTQPPKESIGDQVLDGRQ